MSVGGASASEDDDDEEEKPSKRKSKNASNGRKSKKAKKEDTSTLDVQEMPEAMVKLASWEDKISDITTVEESPQGRRVIFHM